MSIGLSRIAWAMAALLVGCGEASRTSPPEVGRPLAAPARPPDFEVHTRALQGGALHALEAGPPDGPLVLLLHGARYSARTWQDLGTLDRLAREGWHAVALDWPGFGATPTWAVTPDANELLVSVLDELGTPRAVLVAPSMAGRFAFEFARRSSARLAGLVAIAPAGAEIAPDAWSVPTLLVWGAEDEVLPVERGHALAARLPGTRLEVLGGASHACYLDQPDRFHVLLLEFLQGSGVLPGR